MKIRCGDIFCQKNNKLSYLKVLYIGSYSVSIETSNPHMWYHISKENIENNYTKILGLEKLIVEASWN